MKQKKSTRMLSILVLFIVLTASAAASFTMSNTDNVKKTSQIQSNNGCTTFQTDLHYSSSEPTQSQQSSRDTSPEVEWIQTYGDDKYDVGNSVVELPKGYVIVGKTESYSTGSPSDLLFLKTNITGELLIQEEWGEFDVSEEGKCVQMTKDKRLIILATKRDTTQSDAWIMKTRRNGLGIWSRTIGGSSFDHGSYINLTSDGGFIFSGRTKSYSQDQSSDGWFVKTDELGYEQWNRTYGGEFDDFANRCFETKNKSYVLFGCQELTPPEPSGIYIRYPMILKTNTTGDLQWNRTYDIGEGRFSAGVVCSDGTLVYHSKTHIVKVNKTGDILWDFDVNYGPGSKDIRTIQETEDGSIVAVGQDNHYQEAYIVKVNRLGQKQWDKKFSTLISSFGFDIRQTRDGGYIITGKTRNSYPNKMDVLLIKLAAELNLPPDSPSQPYPADGASNVECNVTLSVNVTDINNDVLSVSFFEEEGSLIGHVDDVLSGTRAFCEWRNLTDSTTYGWYAIVNDSNKSITSPVWQFTTVIPNTPPYTPSNPSPGNNSDEVEITTELSWSGGDPDEGDQVSYDVYFGTDAEPPLVEEDNSVSTYDPGVLDYNTTYFWKIVAEDSKGSTTDGPVWSFTTEVAVSNLSINQIKGDFGLYITVNNTGEGDATNIKASLEFSGRGIVLLPGKVSDLSVPETIEAGQEIEVAMLVVGLGLNFDLMVDITADDSTDTKKASCVILGPFIFIKDGNEIK